METLNFYDTIPANVARTLRSGEFKEDIRPIFAEMYFEVGADNELGLSFWDTYRDVPDDSNPSNHGNSLHNQNSQVSEVRGNWGVRRFYFAQDAKIKRNRAIAVHAVNYSLAHLHTLNIDLFFERLTNG